MGNVQRRYNDRRRWRRGESPACAGLKRPSALRRQNIIVICDAMIKLTRGGACPVRRVACVWQMTTHSDDWRRSPPPLVPLDRRQREPLSVDVAMRRPVTAVARGTLTRIDSV